MYNKRIGTRTPKIMVDISSTDLNNFVADCFAERGCDSICVAFADDIMESELYFVIDDGRPMFVLLDDSTQSIPETIFVVEPDIFDYRHFEQEYRMYLARFEFYILTKRLVSPENIEEYKKEIMYGRYS